MSLHPLRLLPLLILVGSSISVTAGELLPWAPPSPTMTSLAEVEARRPLSSVEGSATALRLITEPGSYHLTEPLQGEPGKSGIVIAASEVTLDLRGFTLRGVAGSLSGISVPSPERNITIENGVIEGWPEHGVDAGAADNSTLRNLVAANNGTAPNDHDGLRLGRGGIIAGCVSRGHPAEGISADDGTIVVNCAASENNIGIQGSGLCVTGCNVTGNTFGGMSVGFGSVSECTASFNDGYGIRIDRGSVTRCTVARNGGNGIWVNGSSSVSGNTCVENFSGSGIFAGSGPASGRIEGNTVADNDIGVQALSSGNLIIRNTARGNTTADYSISAGNAHGPIVNVAGVGDISGTPNADHPWANFSH